MWNSESFCYKWHYLKNCCIKHNDFFYGGEVPSSSSVQNFSSLCPFWAKTVFWLWRKSVTQGFFPNTGLSYNYGSYLRAQRSSSYSNSLDKETSGIKNPFSMQQILLLPLQRLAFVYLFNIGNVALRCETVNIQAQSQNALGSYVEIWL